MISEPVQTWVVPGLVPKLHTVKKHMGCEWVGGLKWKNSTPCLLAIHVPCLLNFSWHTWNVLFSDHLPLLPLEERNPFCCWWPRHLQQIDMVGANWQWSAAYSEQKVFDCGTCGAVSCISSLWFALQQITL